MRIGTNPIGNYNPYATPKVRQTESPVKAAQVQKTEQAGRTSSTQAAQVLSTEEKGYFVSLYPNSKAEIDNYHFYQPSGKMSGVSVGMYYDRRG